MDTLQFKQKCTVILLNHVLKALNLLSYAVQARLPQIKRNRMLNGLDLFSGIGGLSVALRPWVKPVAYCEKDRYAQSVLLSRMRSKELDMAPIWDDITTLTASELLSCDIDIIYGGFPCQDISVAGTGKGLDSERSGLYFEIYRLAKETKPKFIFLENVPAIRTRGLDKVVNSLTDLGYDCRWTVVSAAEVGAVHIRKRWFLLAYANSKRLREEQRQKLEGPREVERPLVIDGKSSPRESSTPFPGEVKSAMVRAGDGIPFIVDRNRALGNAVVPRQAREAFMRLIGSREGTATSD